MVTVVFMMIGVCTRNTEGERMLEFSDTLGMVVCNTLKDMVRECESRYGRTRYLHGKMENECYEEEVQNSFFCGECAVKN